MPPAAFLIAFLALVGTVGFTIIKVARIIAARRESPSAELTARLEALEQEVERLQHEHTETLERLDFTERLLSKARE